MGTIRVVNFVTLDGVLQSPLFPDEDTDGGFGHGGWVSAADDPEVAAFMAEVTTSAAALLLGRRTYEGFARTWPQADQSEPPIAAMNRMPKYVVSRTLTASTWQHTSVLGPDLVAEVTRIRAGTDGTVVVFGSGVLVPSLAAHDLVDAYQLLVFPVVLGTGKRMFGPDTPLTRLRLSESVATAGGVVISSYERR